MRKKYEIKKEKTCHIDFVVAPENVPVTEDDKIRVTIHKKSSVKVEESGISSERADELREILEEQREFMQQKVTSLDEKVIALRKIVPDSQRSTTSNRRQEHEFMEH